MSSPQALARDIERLKTDVRNLGTQPRLARSSIDGGALTVRDNLGNDVVYIGEQWDGSFTSTPVGGTPPPSPTMPLVTPIAGGLLLFWDGTFVDDSVTRMDFRRVTFHAVPNLGEDTAEFDVLAPGQIVGEITIATGGEVSVLLPPVEHLIIACAWSESGMFSVESDVAFGTPLGIVDQGALDEVRDLMDVATADLLYLNDVVLPELATGPIEGTRLVANTVHADKLVANSITGDHVAANSLSTSKLIISDFTNTIGDPSFDGELAETDDGTATWRGLGLSKIVSAGVPNALQISASATPHHTYSQGPVDVVYGDQFHATVEFWADAAALGGTATIEGLVEKVDGTFVRVPFLTNAVGQPAIEITAASASNVWVSASGILTVPVDAKRITFSPSIVGGVGKVWRIRRPRVRRMSNGELIVDGTITTANLAADAIDGMVITGATIRSKATGERLEINTDAEASMIKFYSGEALEDTDFPSRIVSNTAGQIALIGGRRTNTPAGLDPARISIGAYSTGLGSVSAMGQIISLSSSGTPLDGASLTMGDASARGNDRLYMNSTMDAFVGASRKLQLSGGGTGGVELNGGSTGVNIIGGRLKQEGSHVAVVGEVRMFAGGWGAGLPAGWLYCEGQAVSRTTYAELFAAISTTHGVGNNSTTFNVPDMRGRAPIGAGTGTAPYGAYHHAPAVKGGVEQHVLTSGEMPIHNHGVYNTGSGGSAVVGDQSALVAAGSSYWAIVGNIFAAGTHNAGSGGAHQNMMPYNVLQFIIFAGKVT